MKLILIGFTILFFSNSSMDQSVETVMTKKIEMLLGQDHLISEKRKEELRNLAKDIYSQQKEMSFSKVTFVCTHNSRRSQLSQVWFWQGLEYFDVKGISSYSGGTEATAFNHRMVDALKRFGFNILKLDESTNPKYLIRSGAAEERELLLFSKKFADGFNPQKDFIAVMVCGQADAECPFVPGAYTRVSLPYEDPKVADDTDKEVKSYDDKVLEIGREILFMTKYLSSLKDNQ